MPRDSHMLPEHSQQLLRVARSGRVYRPPAPVEDDNEMKDEEEEHKVVQVGFVVKKYVKVARHLEVPEPEYLAKRRKGLPSQYAMNGVVQPALRETKVKKLDAEGNATVYKVLVPEGQAVDGEVKPTDAAIEAAPATAAPGTIVEGVGIVNAEGVVVASDILQATPPRRRPPPPKKKGGPGRGKRRVAFAKGATEQGTPTSNPGGDLLATPSVKQEGGSVEPSVEPSDGDTPMADAGGHDDEGSGDEGSDDDDHEGEHTSNPVTPAPTTPAPETPSRLSEAPATVPNLDSTAPATLETATFAIPPSIASDNLRLHVKTESITPLTSIPTATGESVTRDPSSSPDLPLSALSHSRQNSLNQIPTSTTADEPQPEPKPESEPEPEPMEIETTAVTPAQIEIPEVAQVTAPTATEPEVTQVSPTPPPVAAPIPEPAREPEPVPAPTPVPAPVENVSAPPSEPDLMASLDRHLERDSENIAGS
ncbi:hypothetical protein GQ44DRAFT_499328 [Phaeosphaeriaceae sp. PMI808]|nr:hypothetical protein GQ44DRAFT_499328 [Phaeosphaeriaceae sp. PMI808]